MNQKMTSQGISPVIRVQTENSKHEPSVEIIAPSTTDTIKVKKKSSTTMLNHPLPSRSYSLHATSTSLTDCIDNRSSDVRRGDSLIQTGRQSNLLGTYDLSMLEMNANSTINKTKYSNVHGRRISDTTKGISFSSSDTNEEDKKVTQLLARRASHIPGNNWCQDWLQFMKNNHPLFGLCFKHQLHPLGIEERFVMLVGSIAFGVTATNCVFLFYASHELEVDHIVIESTTLDKEIIVTYEMIALWTFGGLVHSMFDLFIWHLSACACFLPGGLCQRCWYLQKIGSYISIALVAVLVAVCSFVIVIRADYEDQDGKIGFSDLNFLIGYGVELGLVYAVYWPLIATILFSGPFSKCIPCVGRPNDLKRQLRERLQEEKEQAKKDEENQVQMY